MPAHSTVVMDLFVNNSFRWEHEDGTLVTAIKSEGGYHMPGPITVCSDDTFKKLVNIVMPLVEEASVLGKIFIPLTTTLSL